MTSKALSKLLYLLRLWQQPWRQLAFACRTRGTKCLQFLHKKEGILTILHMYGVSIYILIKVWSSWLFDWLRPCVHSKIEGLKAASHDSQMLVTATYSQQMTEVISSTSSCDQLNYWGRRMLHFWRRKPSAQVSQDTVS